MTKLFDSKMQPQELTSVSVLRNQGYTSSTARAFEEHGMTGYGLLRLTSADLAEMGLPIGIRKSLLSDIDDLKQRYRRR